MIKNEKRSKKERKKERKKMLKNVEVDAMWKNKTQKKLMVYKRKKKTSKKERKDVMGTYCKLKCESMSVKWTREE